MHNDFNQTIQQNLFTDRADMANAVKTMSKVLKPYYSEGKALIDLGNTASHYDKAKREMEAYSRQLWSLAPLSLYDSSFETVLWQRTGLINGTNPAHSEYWGNLVTGDQRVVEMAAICVSLNLNPDFFFYPLTAEQKSNVLNWLASCNGKQIPQNNWVFFRILVNTTLQLLGGKPDEQQLAKDFARVEELYLGDGWYCDGDINARDYYVSFGIHYYSLIYIKLMRDKDPDRCKIYTDRAIQFAPHFEKWFADDGSALAFGRSQTYRFAQGAFWSALAFAEIEALPWGKVKGLVLRHLRWWFSKPIFSKEGILTIGYGYPGQATTESYNAPGSPYWASKTFLVLALSENHPFWQAQEESLTDYGIFHQPHARMLINRQQRGAVTAFVVGQATNNMGGMTHKYEKFVYTSHLGFNISRGTELFELGLDGTLAYSLDGGKNYILRPKVSKFNTTNQYVYAEWGDRFIQGSTYLVPIGQWHIRIHTVTCGEEDILLAEGGFVVPSEQQNLNFNENPSCQIKEQTDSLQVYSPFANIAVQAYSGQQPKLIDNLPHSNILHPKTKQSLLLSSLKKGEQRLVSGFYLDASKAKMGISPAPLVQLEENRVTIKTQDFELNFTL